MTSSAKIIRIKIEHGKNVNFYATSPDLTGLEVTDRNLNDLYDLIPDAIIYIMQLLGKDVVACGKIENYPLDPNDEYKHAWVVITCP